MEKNSRDDRMSVNIRRKEKKDTGRIKSNFTLDVKFNKIRSDYGWSFWEILRSGSHKNHYGAPDLNFYTFKGPGSEIHLTFYTAWSISRREKSTKYLVYSLTDEKTFTLATPVNSQNDRVYYEARKKKTSSSNETHTWTWTLQS